MKACFLFVFAAAAVLALAFADESQKELMKRIHKECAEENAVAPPALCKFNKLKFMHEGTINKDVMEKSIRNVPGITEEATAKIATECGKSTGATPGDVATALDKCLKDNLHPYLAEHHDHH